MTKSNPSALVSCMVSQTSTHNFLGRKMGHDGVVAAQWSRAEPKHKVREPIYGLSSDEGLVNGSITNTL